MGEPMANSAPAWKLLTVTVQSEEQTMSKLDVTMAAGCALRVVLMILRKKAR